MNNLRKIVYRSRFFGKILSEINNYFQFILIGFYKDEKIVKLIKEIRNEVDFAFYPIEAYQIYSIVKSQKNLNGDIAEVGVFQGGSAKLICEAKGNKELHLFDTFEGLPKVSKNDTHFGIEYWKTGEFSNTSLEKVKTYLSKYQNVKFYKGNFPDSSSPVENKKFAFVHLDVDLYESTINCLQFFYPRMINGGIILTHDFHTEGVKKAFSEFFIDKKVNFIELSGSQCLVSKFN